jgi:hypothetical protein
MQPSSLPCYLLPLRPTHLSQHSILIHPQPTFHPDFQTDEDLYPYKTSAVIENNNLKIIIIIIIIIIIMRLPHRVLSFHGNSEPSVSASFVSNR